MFRYVIAVLLFGSSAAWPYSRSAPCRALLALHKNLQQGDPSNRSQKLKQLIELYHTYLVTGDDKKLIQHQVQQILKASSNGVSHPPHVRLRARLSALVALFQDAELKQASLKRDVGENDLSGLISTTQSLLRRYGSDLIYFADPSPKTIRQINDQSPYPIVTIEPINTIMHVDNEDHGPVDYLYHDTTHGRINAEEHFWPALELRRRKKWSTSRYRDFILARAAVYAQFRNLVAQQKDHEVALALELVWFELFHEGTLLVESGTKRENPSLHSEMSKRALMAVMDPQRQPQSQRREAPLFYVERFVREKLEYQIYGRLPSIRVTAIQEACRVLYEFAIQLPDDIRAAEITDF